MPGYTIKNLREVEDMGRKFGMAPDVSARFATGDLGLTRRVKLDDEIVEAATWDAVRVEPSVTRAFSAGPDGLELLAIIDP